MMSNDELKLTNLDKVFWPEEGYTKGDVIHYYEQIADVILPYLKDRPMVLNRHPNGILGESFFQKNVDKTKIPSFIRTARVKHTEKSVQYILVQDKRTLLYVANLGCIELNPFHARISKLDRPDYGIIDLDPENVSFERVIEGAQIVRDLLRKARIESYCKTTGGRGLHIYIPLAARYDYEHVRAFIEILAHLALDKAPTLFSLATRPKDRQGRVHIDVLRNAATQTIASVYCLRPRPHALVSAPLRWQEVKSGLDPAEFDIRSMPRRLKAKGDLFAGVLGKPADLKKALSLLGTNLL